MTTEVSRNTDRDDDLIYFFKNFETILSSKPPDIDRISSNADFKVFSEYFAKDISDIQHQLVNADEAYLLYVSEHLYNIIDWLKLILENRLQVFGDALESLFNREFGDKKILHTLYRSSFDKWIVGKSGQHKVGANTYSIADEVLYYRDRFKIWYVVDKDSAFDIKPTRSLFEDDAIITRLNEAYEDTAYDLIIKKWENKDYQDVLAQDFSKFKERVTTPEDYFDFTEVSIRKLLDKPVSITELERWNGKSIIDLEDTIKLCNTALDIVKERRKDKAHTLYLLRDCMVFYEINKALDILSSEEASSDQLLISRKTLSNKPDQWGYYIAILEALYESHARHTDDFSAFYDEFARLLDLFASVNDGFRIVINNSADYIKNHLKTNEKRIVVFDVGFQGTINLFIKYVIDRYIQPTAELNQETEIEVAVGAQWSKELFADRIGGDYFPFLNRFQQLARSDELYHYQFGSLRNGQVKVKLGDAQSLRKAATELVVLVMLAKITYED